MTATVFLRYMIVTAELPTTLAVHTSVAAGTRCITLHLLSPCPFKPGTCYVIVTSESIIRAGSLVLNLYGAVVTLTHASREGL